MLARRRLPGNDPHTIEANQPEFRTQPEIAVRRLHNSCDPPGGKAFAGPPRRVPVLADIPCRFNANADGHHANTALANASPSATTRRLRSRAVRVARILRT